MKNDKHGAPVSQSELYARIALKNGLLTILQIHEARLIQKKVTELGIESKSLPSILLEKGFLTKDQHEKIRAHVDRLAPPAVIKGYAITKRLGKGSMGSVYKARQEKTGRVLAVKILAPFLQKNSRFVSRFIKEAKAMARLNHVNIVQCVDVGISNGSYYMAMEFCDGPTVSDILKRGGAMGELRAAQIIQQVAEALDHAHRDLILHRDIKPANIMVVQNGIAKLSDLGLVKDLESDGDTTDAGVTLGTPNYISPEQARGDDVIDSRSDIYSLGATFYHMVAGCTPFVHANPAVVMVAHINEVPMTPGERNPDLSTETNRIIQKMMRKTPSDRYQTPNDLVQDMRRLVASLGGRPSAPPERPLSRKPRRRRR